MADKEQEETPPTPSRKHGFVDWEQGAVLADRYLETTLADWKNTGILLIQAPLLAFLAVMVWSNVDRPTEALYFVMVLSALWLGCTNSCREIVKERPLFLRERLVNLNVGSYLYSKVRILALLSAVQIFCYAMIIWKWIDVRVPIGWLLVALYAVSLCGVCLGLLISSSVSRSDYAVGLVPLVIIPQIIFSEFAIKADQFTGVSEWIFKSMPSRWGFESLKEFAQTNANQLEAAGYLIPLLLFCVVFLVLSYPILRAQRF